ncbi:Formamidopyrimidine-DNA glycosylase [Commensalibacter sp. Nvir]|uniref:bifunctional DNA-formamidopyrimidine glycosylase/DNA-(apurinic or apyrimidinic site) lyase n=1 Tax=Commensalibacter sp. Nvir TaxID=3069817 RepID=UPI002D385351|nr:Formamidopyrimidine-DNA glycosylase [Commensalibacter sp. Nvir]
MPELPEVEIVKKNLEDKLKKQTIVFAKCHRETLRIPLSNSLSTHIIGARMMIFTRRGKYISIELNNQLTILIHLGMSGKIIINSMENRDKLTPAKHEHFTLLTKEGYSVHYIDARRFGLIDLYNSSEVHPLLRKMGPEPLVSSQALDKLCSELKKRANASKVPIKNLLLDQHIIAGLGNIYVCEALFLAKISPLRRFNTLSDLEILKLIKAIQSVLKQAIHAGGSSMRDYVHADGKKGNFQFCWYVYNRENQFCKRCLKFGKSNFIKRVKQSGRSSFYCEYCQH